MGAKNSVELLDLPLIPQTKPVRTCNRSRITETLTSFQITPPCFSNTIEVIDTNDDAVAFTLKRKSFSSKRVLRTSDGIPLMATRSAGAFSNHWNVFEGEDTEARDIFQITTKVRLTSRMIVYVDFTDRVTGMLCRLLIEGNASDRVVVIYLARGLERLPPLEKRDNYFNPCYQAVGRIHRPANGMFTKDAYFIEVASGIDLTIVLMLWMRRFDKYEEEKQQAASGG